MKRKTLVSLLTLLCSAAFCHAVDKVSVVVEGQLTETQEQIVNSAFTARLSSSKDFTVFERNDTFLNALTREQDYQVSGNVPDDQIRKIASRYGVDYVVTVNVNTEEDNLYMSARLIDIETGKVVKTVNQDRASSSLKTLKNLSNNVAYRLIDKKSK